ncbi:rCG63498 [Rattus norvegicus]|uniref:RCG63498 n=1 Tax=Rattus norvegicus TaxID=10116 RepID=A6HKH8_RAT|nr:rCG63498 [Rattus norvegicus]
MPILFLEISTTCLGNGATQRGLGPLISISKALPHITCLWDNLIWSVDQLRLSSPCGSNFNGTNPF